MNRIKELRKTKGYTQNKLCAILNITQGNLSAWETERWQPDNHSLSKLADIFDVSIDYLLGRTDIPNSFPNKKELPDDYLPPNARPLSDYDLYKVPILGTVKAGVGGHAEEDVSGYDYITKRDLQGEGSEEFFFLTVRGDSMQPELMEGDRVLVHKQSSVDSGSLAVVLVDGEEGVIKYVEYGRNWIELISVNPEYEPRRFENAEVERVLVVGLVKKAIRVFD